MLVVKFASKNQPEGPVSAVLIPVTSRREPVGTWQPANPDSGHPGTWSDAASGDIPVGQALMSLRRSGPIGAVISASIQAPDRPATESTLRKAFYYGLLVAEANQSATVWVPVDDWLVPSVPLPDAIAGIAETLRRIRQETGLLETVILAVQNESHLAALSHSVAASLGS